MLLPVATKTARGMKRTAMVGTQAAKVSATRRTVPHQPARKRVVMMVKNMQPSTMVKQKA